MIVKVDELYHNFQEELFAVIGEEIDPTFSDDEDEPESELKLLGVTPLLPGNIEKVKIAFDEELNLLKNQYKNILDKKYEDLNKDAVFNNKLQEFCCIVKPDSEFFQEIKKKELGLFDYDKNDFENALTVESIDVNKSPNTNKKLAADLKITITKAKSIDIDGEGRFEISDDEGYPGKRDYTGLKTPKKSAGKTMDDMGLGTKSTGFNMSDFTGMGGGDDEMEDDIFEILSVPDCSPFYMTNLQGCKIL